jgi:hypothetical protein
VQLRIIRPPRGSVDGIDLNHFEVGSVYEVGTSLGSYLLAIEAAEPAADKPPPPVAPLEPELLEELRDNAKQPPVFEKAADRPHRKRKR